MKQIKIGLLGLGNVGKCTYEILKMNYELIQKRLGVQFEVSKILVNDIKKDRGIKLESGVLTSNAEDILENPEIDIVVEVLGGVQPATDYMLRAMKNGKHVVTANKAAVAANYMQLINAAKENRVIFKMEASVAGAIPILTSIQTQLAANSFTEVMGIVNGTTNYILTKMTEEGLAYEEVLKKAQELGFAEADPTADVEGIDVANKLTILMKLLFGKYIAPENIARKGITQITMEDIQEAKKRGCKIKLIAHAKVDEAGKLSCSVAPMELSKDHPLAAVGNEFNAVYVIGNACGELMFYGRGAGPLPTGSAVAGDILSVIREM